MMDIINEDRIKENLKDFSFPRLSGTIFEEKAFDIAKEKISALNLKFDIQNFEFSTFYSRIYPKITFPIFFWLIFLFYIDIDALFFVINIFTGIGIILPLFILTRKPENIRLGKCLKSQNLYVKLNSDSINNNIKSQKNHFFFIAHLDSKGQTITVKLRAYTMLLLFISSFSILIVLTLRFIFFNSLYLFFTYIGIIPIMGLFVGTAIFTLNRTNNNSKGVVDNASGVACVLELLHYFASNEKNLNSTLWFVLTGAEESGTMGIRYFSKLLNENNCKNSIVHNFESLGNEFYVLSSKTNPVNIPDYYEYFIKKTKEHHINTRIISFTRGIHTDGIYLLRKGFNEFEYGSSNVGKYMHSDLDSLKNVNPAQLVRLCKFVIDTLNFKN